MADSVKHHEAKSSLIERAIQRLSDPNHAPEPRTSSSNQMEIAAPDPESGPRSADSSKSGTGNRSKSGGRSTTKRVIIDLEKLRAAGGFSPTGLFTRTTEEFRMVKRSVLHNAAKRKEQGSTNGNLIMVTSAREGEGKTFVAVNLAMSIAAERNRNVLLIDADLSKPAIPQRLGIETGAGLVNVLEDPNLDLSSVLLRTNIDGLTILPAGPHHPLASELLASTRMETFMAEVAQRYADRIVILDAPPVLATSEPATLAMHVGQIAFVVETSKTSQAAIKEALGLVSICPDIGFVLNKVPFQFGTTRFGSYYKHYGKSYYRASKRETYASQGARKNGHGE